MAYIGIGYSGSEPGVLRSLVERHMAWLKGDRAPRLFGDDFVVLYDSNTAREFAHKCMAAAPQDSIRVYPMDAPIEQP
jgi:hypothetical protein